MYKITRTSDRVFYKFDTLSAFVDIQGNVLRNSRALLKTREVSEYDFFRQLFSEGESKLNSRMTYQEYQSLYTVLHKAMREVCQKDIDINVPEVVIDYLNFSHN